VCSCSLLPVLLAGGSRVQSLAETPSTRPPLIHPVLRRSVTLARTLAAGSLAVRTSEGDAAMHPAPEDYLLGQRSRRNYRSQSTQPPLEAVRRPTLAFGSRHMSAPVLRCFDARRPKSRAGSRFSLPTLNWWSEPPATLLEQGGQARAGAVGDDILVVRHPNAKRRIRRPEAGCRRSLRRAGQTNKQLAQCQ
jgi:hypothetical protein